MRRKHLTINTGWRVSMTNSTRPLRISVAGSGSATEAELKTAEETGRLLARRGAVLLCGGLGGVMEAACRGASSEGGITVGILPGPDAEAANPYVSIPVPTGLGEARNAIVAIASDALIAIGGSLGTLSEIALALKRGIPVIGLDTWSLDEQRMKLSVLHQVAKPSEAVELACSLAGPAPHPS
jgi:uncharacterized protein (TIGR00725 family)